jgi:hypothetical protein
MKALGRSLGEQDVHVCVSSATVPEQAMVKVLKMMKLAKTSEYLSNNKIMAQIAVKHES